ncbi:hypothetical protein AB0392_24295 [Nonomuraea angiospora]|uniref:hypothetical protein n=1 Tax=Nonomuraea angiospora TaxID=46172 RepID=UPI00344DB148
MSRRSSALWASAVLLAVLPSVLYRIDSLLSEPEYAPGVYGFVTMYSCWTELYVRSWDSMLRDFPLFSYGGAPMIVLGFAGWYASLRKGRDRLGRILARSAATVLLLSYLPQILVYALDPRCLDPWTAVSPMDLYALAPPILVLLAAHPPRRASVRRGRLARTAVVVLTVTATLLVAVGSVPPGKVSADGELDCAGFGGGTVEGLRKEEKDFLCRVRGYGFSLTEGIEEWNESSDRIVLSQGHHLCDLAERHGGDLGAPAVREAPHASLLPALATLCPSVASRQAAQETRKREEEDAYVAGKERACARHRTHRPRIKPVRQRRATMSTQFWTIQGWEDGYEGRAPDLVENLVGSEPGALTIWAADEIGYACVTVESYTRRPPLETRGWKEVVEVGYESPKGSLSLSDGGGRSIQGLTAAGPGHYRVRVHLRGREQVYQVLDPPDGAVELLVMVFPGEQKEPVVHR